MEPADKLKIILKYLGVIIVLSVLFSLSAYYISLLVNDAYQQAIIERDEAREERDKAIEERDKAIAKRDELLENQVKEDTEQ